MNISYNYYTTIFQSYSIKNAITMNLIIKYKYFRIIFLKVINSVII